MPEIWAGLDIGKEHHHCVVIAATGERLLSRRVLNDETQLLELIGDVLDLSYDVLWAVDINRGGAALAGQPENLFGLAAATGGWPHLPDSGPGSWMFVITMSHGIGPS